MVMHREVWYEGRFSPTLVAVQLGSTRWHAEGPSQSPGRRSLTSFTCMHVTPYAAERHLQPSFAGIHSVFGEANQSQVKLHHACGTGAMC